MNAFELVCFVYFLFSSLIGKAMAFEPSLPYSIQFHSPGPQTVTFRIKANGVVTETSVDITSATSDWINFSASRSFPLSVQIMSYVSVVDLYYIINYGNNGDGSELYDSRADIFTPVNPCPSGTCELTFQGDVDFSASQATIYVNNEYIQQVSGSTPYNFPVAAGDIIRVEFSYDSADTDPSYYLLEAELDIYNNWYYNAFGDNTLIFSAIPGSDRSPTGGALYPITTEQSSAFASSIGGGTQNSAWSALTQPI